jgi:hypothetical protein
VQKSSSRVEVIVARLGWVAVAGLLAAGLPLFVCLPVWCDVTLFDLCTRNVLGGGVHYRDLFDNNLPGMLWLHLAVRSLVGGRSEAIRLVDFGVVAIVVALLAIWLRRQGRSPLVLSWTVFALLACYLSMNERCHCQRDTWMLLPALLALFQRQGQLERWQQGRSGPAARFSHAALEGLCWAAACWIKPFVIVPAGLVWLASLLLGRRAGIRFTVLLGDAAGLLAGGLLAGLLGVAWMGWSGALAPFFDIFLRWNGEYVTSHQGVPLFKRCLVPLDGMSGWHFLHALAVPQAISLLLRAWRGSAPDNRSGRQVLLAALYLGWFVEAYFLQARVDYVQVPALLLGITVLAGSDLLPASALVRVAVPALLVLHFLVFSPLAEGRRLACWSRCFVEGSSPQLRDELTLTEHVGWQDLERVLLFLKSEGVKDGEVTCYHAGLCPLYFELDRAPSTRYVNFDQMLAWFPGHREEVRRTLADSRQRYLVADVKEVDRWWREEGPPRTDEPARLPDNFPEQWRGWYPWNQTLLFRAGRYLVFRAAEPPREKLWPEVGFGPPPREAQQR